jgi:DNA modification methylase
MSEATPYRRKEVIGDATLYLGDCREILPTLGRVDAVITDPPYGINENDSKIASRGKLAQPKDYGSVQWDKSPIGETEVALIRACSKWQIIFGGNYFPLPPSSCWLVWDKQNGDNDFADCELAWTNMPKAVRRIYWRWNGMIRKGSDERVHPTQKPVGVMRWCIEQLPADVTTVLDPYAGSGTTGVACIREGKAFIGIEREEAYFEHAVRRLREAAATPDMFVERPAPAKQEQLL